MAVTKWTKTLAASAILSERRMPNLLPSQVEHQQYPRHDRTRTLADCAFDFSHGFARQVPAHAFEHHHFEEHRADESDGCQQVNHEKQGIGHSRRLRAWP